MYPCSCTQLPPSLPHPVPLRSPFGRHLRRRRWLAVQTFEAKVTEFCSSMGALRADEIVAREAFLQTHLPNLPPVFVEVRTHDTCLQ